MNQQEKVLESTESIKNILLKTPRALSILDPDVIEVADYLLPYSVGFEIECFMKNEATFPKKDFADIPNIMHTQIDSSEQRFRIPNGIEGLICLEDITLLLKQHSLLDPDSGIHYHIDCTDSYDMFNSELIKTHEPWILLELEQWDYKGNYNKKRCAFDGSANWLRFQSSYKTAEFRIGEMTFEYSTILTRMIHACDIISRLKNYAVNEYVQKHNPILQYKKENINEILTNRIEKI